MASFVSPPKDMVPKHKFGDGDAGAAEMLVLHRSIPAHNDSAGERAEAAL